MVSPAGDEWEALYRRYGRTVLHAATLAAGGSAYDGWDGVQHAFSQAWLYLTEPSRPPVHNWVGWLRKSAVRYVVQAAKSEARALPLLDRDQQQDGPLLENWVAVKADHGCRGRDRTQPDQPGTPSSAPAPRRGDRR
ncbi:hypothetical protein GCM10009548_86800 [Streptomyces malaysiensis subsp. malaysiensis]